ncbi:MAG: 1-(5-phosphoribosyl)-5-[(5-phosphoribosylamino)methylideneamino]imidazole-4-carboxamide isomerase [Oscillospiraceae bacterium]|nr:1-(5-phosphoribosyl)-5-[(5-phosphoribosylamino)methylideneamino]imidazole-4-carboxamide isomerase [Oscillospiraceae bacterium]
MILFPAIDLKDGKVVRLYKGDFATVHQVSNNVQETAGAFFQAGARHIHMVDLDGAKDGKRANSSIVQAVAEGAGLHVELGGGIRSMGDLEAVFALGVHRAVIGSAAVHNPDFVQSAVAKYGARIAVGIDAFHDRVRTAGWVEDSGLNYLDFARSMEDLGVKTIIFTDIETDGMLSGPAYAQLEKLQAVYSGQLVASGGISVLEDIQRLRDMGLYGAIIGKAYYAGTLDLAKAVALCGPQE